MRSPNVMRIRGSGWLTAMLLGLLACGGGTPQPVDADEGRANTQPRSSAAPASAPASRSSGAEAAEKPPSAAPSSPPVDPLAAATSDDPWMASHQMTQKDVLAGVRAVLGKTRECFRQGVKRDPSTSGEVKIRFVVTNPGAVRVWRDDGSSMSDEDVTKCIGDLIQGTKFPKQKSPGDAWGIYTANFSD